MSVQTTQNGLPRTGCARASVRKGKAAQRPEITDDDGCPVEIASAREKLLEKLFFDPFPAAQ